MNFDHFLSFSLLFCFDVPVYNPVPIDTISYTVFINFMHVFSINTSSILTNNTLQSLFITKHISLVIVLFQRRNG